MLPVESKKALGGEAQAQAAQQPAASCLCQYPPCLPSPSLKKDRNILCLFEILSGRKAESTALCTAWAVKQILPLHRETNDVQHMDYTDPVGVLCLSSGHITQATPDLFSTLTLSWVELS